MKDLDSRYWNPELVIQNGLEEPKERVWHELRHGTSGEAYIYEMRRIKGKFFEKMELYRFPFDVQVICGLDNWPYFYFIIRYSVFQFFITFL